MSKADRLFEKMRANPQKDWRMSELETVAQSRGLRWRRPGGGSSHQVFIREDGRTLSVPGHRPIKPIYIKKFIDLLEE